MQQDMPHADEAINKNVFLWKKEMLSHAIATAAGGPHLNQCFAYI